MEHKNLVINHRIESWVYADDAARTGAIGFTNSDVGRVAYQTDTGQYWRLTDDSPVTWAAIVPADAVVSVFGRTGAVVAAANDYSYAQLSGKPTTLAGYGITDAVSSVFGRTGTVVAATNDYSYAQLSGKPVYASAQLAPTSPTAVTGTANKAFGMGGTIKLTPTASGKVNIVITVALANTTGGSFTSNIQMAYGTGTAPANGATTGLGTLTGGQMQTNATNSLPETFSTVLTGLTVSTAYWFDLISQSSNAAATSNVLGVAATIVELP